MITLGVLPWLFSALACLAARRVGNRLTARAAVIFLTLFSLAAATATGLSLSVLGLLSIGEISSVASLAHWSGTVLSASSPVPLVVGVPGAVIVITLRAASTIRLHHSLIRLARAAIVCRRLGPAPGGLVVIEDDQPMAYALPGLTGRIVVTTSMLRALAPDERRALLEHEAAHLRHHHYLYVQLAGLAAAANPLLRPVAGAVRVGVERWADDDAAALAGDRRVVARSLAVAGLARANQPRAVPDSALGAAESELRQRVEALLTPVRPGGVGVLILVLAMTACCLASTFVIGVSVHALFETAQAAYHRRG